MVCTICHKRKATRFCPAKSEKICAVCCATEREVTIDCPTDCPHLITSRHYEEGRREIDWSNLPFADVKVSPSAFGEHAGLLDALVFAICEFGAEERALVDADVIAALQALAEAYQTLAKGIYYEKAPGYRVQRELYERLKKAIAAYQKSDAARRGVSTLRDGLVRDALIFLTQLGATRSNGRPKGRAYLDFLRSQFKRGETAQAGSPLLVVP